MKTRTRYSGNIKIELKYIGIQNNRFRFKGRVILGDESWKFHDVLVERNEKTESEGVTEVAYDLAAAGAIHYASRYKDETAPTWAPSREFAQLIEDNKGDIRR